MTAAKANKTRARRLKRLREDIRNLAATDAQRMILELRLEGMKDESIAHELRSTGESVRKWGKGFLPTAPNADKIRELHSQVLFLKEHGVMYLELRAQKKTIAQAYDETKGQAA